MNETIITLSQWLETLAGDAEPWATYAHYLPRLIDGILLTIELVVVSGLIGVLIAIPVGLMRVSNNSVGRAFSYAYIFFFRGTPLLVQIYLVYYGLSQFDIIRETGWLWKEVLSQPYWCAMIAFSLNTAAYSGELLRGAIQAVPYGEIEAAQALGLPRATQYRRIILPRAFRIILPAYGNEVVLMLKGSALASTITLLDLMGATRSIIARTYMNMEFFLLAGVFYLIMAAVLIFFFRFIERKLNAHKHISQPRLPDIL